VLVMEDWWKISRIGGLHINQCVEVCTYYYEQYKKKQGKRRNPFMLAWYSGHDMTTWDGVRKFSTVVLS